MTYNRSILANVLGNILAGVLANRSPKYIPNSMDHLCFSLLWFFNITIYHDMSPTVTMLNENARAFTYPRVPQCHHIEGSDSYDPNTSSMVTSTLKMRMDFPFNFLYIFCISRIFYIIFRIFRIQQEVVAINLTRNVYHDISWSNTGRGRLMGNGA